MSLNILISTPTFPPFNSGLGNAVQEQARMLAKLGHHVTVATYGLHRESISVDGYVVEKFHVEGADSLINSLRGEIETYRTFLLDSNFDIVLLNAWQTWSTDIALRILDSISGKKILCSHCLSVNLFFMRTPIKSALRYLLWRPYYFRLSSYLRRLDGLVALADRGCDSRFDDLSLAKSVGTKIYVIPNALPAGMSAPYPLLTERTQIISVGAYDWQKGHDFVLQAYAKSVAKNKVPLKFFGQKFNGYTDELRRLSRALGIEAHSLSFHEGVTDDALREQYRRALVFVCGSHTECQPLVLLDAMATGTPFVSRASGCIDSMLGGIAVRSPEAAAAELDRLLTDGVLWQRKSAAGLQGAIVHSHESVMQNWDQTLQQILNLDTLPATLSNVRGN